MEQKPISFKAGKIVIKDFKYNYNKAYSDTTMSLSKNAEGVFIYNARFNQSVDYDSMTVRSFDYSTLETVNQIYL